MIYLTSQKGLIHERWKTYVDDTENESVLGAHGKVTATGIAVNGSFESSLYEELMHFLDASNLVRGSIDCEHEHEDDGEENRSVGAVQLW
jgi:hypothetical protein